MVFRIVPLPEPASDPVRSAMPPPAFLRLLRIALTIRAEEGMSLTIEDAMDRAIAENPELYDRYLTLVAWYARAGRPLPSAFTRDVLEPEKQAFAEAMSA